ncbi:hypothetical protein V8E36_003201 [Tilletia maclaganii]
MLVATRNTQLEAPFFAHSFSCFNRQRALDALTLTSKGHTELERPKGDGRKRASKRITLAEKPALPTHLAQPLTHIEELPEPITLDYAASILSWAEHALSVVCTHACRSQLSRRTAHTQPSPTCTTPPRYPRPSRPVHPLIRTIAAGVEALNPSVGIDSPA